MPIYAYRCEACGFAKDALQKISDAPLTDCPACGEAKFKKQLTAAGFQLKGTGWYVTDFRNGSSGGKPGTADANKAEGASAGDDAAGSAAGTGAGDSASGSTSSASAGSNSNSNAGNTATSSSGAAGSGDSAGTKSASAA
ncbi:MAG: FmdB family zinc ribbon protein [Betaproteobacteria bacterium]